jgi:hypothetical protein
VDRVVAIGDVHGDFERFTAVLRSASLIEYATDEHRELSVAV